MLQGTSTPKPLCLSLSLSLFLLVSLSLSDCLSLCRALAAKYRIPHSTSTPNAALWSEGLVVKEALEVVEGMDAIGIVGAPMHDGDLPCAEPRG